MTTTKRSLATRPLLNKVPEITVYFWIIKVLCTTVGETAADFLNVNLNFGLTGTSIATGVVLAIALVFQFRAPKYIPSVYWLTVTLVSVFGTLVTDNLTDNLGLPLEASTLIFGALLALTFLVWYRTEHTLSIHSIVTRRREAFYWLAILFTFALGTASGDLMAERLGLGYLVTGIIVAALIAITAVGWKLGLNSVLSFWIIYILTRPLGASIGDFLSQPSSHGGLGLGTTVTSIIFVGGIIGIVVYLSVTKADVITGQPAHKNSAPGSSALSNIEPAGRGGVWQTVVVVCLVLVAGGTGYYLRTSALDAESSDTSGSQQVSAGVQSSSGSSLGDLSTFRTITQDSLDLLTAGDQSGATTRIGDLEYEWDNAQARLKSKDGTAWTEVDGKIDTVLRELRSTSPQPDQEQAALTALLAMLG
jgi:uncharacterized membrane-anchored protein